MTTLRIRRGPARPARLLRNAHVLSLIVFGAVGLLAPALAQQQAGQGSALLHASAWGGVPPSQHPAFRPAGSSLTTALFGQPATASSASSAALFSSPEDSIDVPTGLGQDGRVSALEPPAEPHDVWLWQVLPDGLIYRSYLAGVKESRFASHWVHDVRQGWMWDVALGGRVGILRYGTAEADRPQGWQLDIEGAGMPRLDLERERDVVSADFRFGIPLTYGRGRYQAKFAYYHLSSHLGDEYMVRNNTLERLNFSRDVLVWGHSFYWTEDWRLYAEAGWAFQCDGGSRPWEFQFGADYSPAAPNGMRGSPFWAINGHLRQEFDFGGHLAVQTGWQWRGPSGHLFRIGMHYFQGMSDQWEFFNKFEDKLGFGIWYDH